MGDCSQDVMSDSDDELLEMMGGNMSGMAQALDDDAEHEQRAESLRDLECALVQMAQYSDAKEVLEDATAEGEPLRELAQAFLSGDFAVVLSSPFAARILLEGAGETE